VDVDVDVDVNVVGYPSERTYVVDHFDIEQVLKWHQPHRERSLKDKYRARVGRQLLRSLVRLYNSLILDALKNAARYIRLRRMSSLHFDREPRVAILKEDVNTISRR
jgi:hypothetical protein